MLDFMHFSFFISLCILTGHFLEICYFCEHLICSFYTSISSFLMLMNRIISFLAARESSLFLFQGTSYSLDFRAIK